MTFNLAPSSAKKKLTPNPDPARLDVGDCQRAAIIWFEKALSLTHPMNKQQQNSALDKACMYEQMMFDGRK